MGISGPAPKAADQRARRNRDTFAGGGKVLVLHRAERQDLPDDLLAREDWHPATRRWWSRWADSVLAKDFTEVEWSELEVAAVCHHRFMVKPSFAMAGELRQRMAKYGATPEDRAKLRLSFADADEKERAGAASTPVAASRIVYGPLTAAPVSA